MSEQDRPIKAILQDMKEAVKQYKQGSKLLTGALILDEELLPEDWQDRITKINSAEDMERTRLKQLYFTILCGSCKPLGVVK